MNHIEAMKLALEALKSSHESGSVGVKIDNAIAALRQALEQPDVIEAAVLAEREACAKTCESLRPSKSEYDQRFYDGCTASSAAIRERAKS